MKLKKTICAFVLLATLLTSGAELLTAPPAAAATCPTSVGTPYGTTRWCGFFWNRYNDVGQSVINGGIGSYDINNLISNLERWADYDKNNGGRQNQMGALFIMATMAGYHPPLVNDASQLTYIRWNLWPTVRDRLIRYSQVGAIDWNYNAPLQCGTLNSFFQPITNGGNIQTNGDVAYYYENMTYHKDSHGNSIPDNNCGPTVTVPSIKFEYNGSVYIIKRSCGNPMGRTDPIQDAGYSHDISITGPAGPLEVNKTYCLLASTTKVNGANSAGRGNMWVTLPNGVTFASATAPYTYPYNGSNALWPDVGAGGIAINNGATMSRSVCFTVNPSSAGKTLTFINTWWPKTQNGDAATASISFAVTNPFVIVPKLQPGGGTPPAPGPISADNNYTLLPCVINSGSGASIPVTETVTVPSNAEFVSASTGGVYNNATRVITWPDIVIPANSTNCTRSFVFKPLTPGSNVTLTETVSPIDAGGGSSSDSITYQVRKERYPSVQGWGSDVHAGGGFLDADSNCVATPGSGSITGNTHGGSYGQYVVSAKGAIGNFGSNNSSSGWSASVGRSGSYYTVCRPDLVAAAQAYTGYRTIATASISMSDALFSTDGVYKRSGDLTITGGTFSKKITIFVTGNLTITGNVKLNGAVVVAGNMQPSLGIITAGDITIRASATDLDAYIFANGAINTCAEGASDACSNTLTVNGFLMADSISFRRLGPVTAGHGELVDGERVIMTGQLFVNPPALFSALADGQLLQLKGERPPLN